MKNKVNNGLFDKEFRSKLRKNPKMIYEMGSDYQNDIKYEVVTNTKDTTYVVIPSEQSINLSSLELVGAEGCTSSVGSVGSVGTLGSVGCALGCFSTVGSASTVGSIGSAGSVDINK